MSDLDRTGRAEPQDALANNCFVCGAENPIGLKVKFSIVNEVCIGSFTPQIQHTGYDNLTHGGILFSLLDDVMANWAWLQGKKCFTAKADIRYRQELPIGTEVLLEGRCTKLRGRLAQMEGLIIRKDDQSVVAESTGSFMMDSIQVDKSTD